MHSPTPDQLVLILLPYVFSVAFVLAAIYTWRAVARAVRYYTTEGTWQAASTRLALGAGAASALLLATSFAVVVMPTAQWRQSESIQTTWDWVIAWGYAGYAITAGVLLLLTMLAVITITAGVLCGPLVQEIRDIRLQRRAQSQTSHTVAAPS